MYIINSPLDQFDIKLFIGFQSSLFNIDFININTFTIYLFLVILVIYFIYAITNNDNKIVGGKGFIINEIIYDTIINIVKSIVEGKYWGYYFPLIFTMFLWILTANLISMIPYSFALTSQIVFIISLSMIIWLGNTIQSIYLHGWKFFNLFVPVGTPLFLLPLLIIIEFLSYTARSISLGLRLSSNILAGHLLMIILSGLLVNFIMLNLFALLFSVFPMIVILGIMVLEFAIAIIQSYVWAILMSSYLKDSLYTH